PLPGSLLRGPPGLRGGDRGGPGARHRRRRRARPRRPAAAPEGGMSAAPTTVAGPAAPPLTLRGAFSRLGGWVVWLFLCLLAISALYPLLFLTATALRTPTDYRSSPGGLPSHLTTGNVSEAFTHVHIGTFALNSLLVVAPAVAVITVVSCLAGYALIHFD